MAAFGNGGGVKRSWGADFRSCKRIDERVDSPYSPPHEAQMSKLSAIFKKADTSNQENIAQHPLSLGGGDVPIEGTSDTPPRRRR